MSNISKLIFVMVMFMVTTVVIGSTGCCKDCCIQDSSTVSYISCVWLTYRNWQYSFEQDDYLYFKCVEQNVFADYALFFRMCQIISRSASYLLIISINCKHQIYFCSVIIIANHYSNLHVTSLDVAYYWFVQSLRWILIPTFRDFAYTPKFLLSLWSPQQPTSRCVQVKAETREDWCALSPSTG